MNSKTLVTMGLIAAMLMTGCAGKTGTGTQTDAAQADTAQTEVTAVEAKTEIEAGAAQETVTAELVKYESAEGWSASYDKSVIEVTEDDGTSCFRPYAHGSGSRYNTLFQTAHGSVKETLNDIIVQLRFPKRLGKALIEAMFKDESEEVAAFIKTRTTETNWSL